MDNKKTASKDTSTRQDVLAAFTHPQARPAMDSYIVARLSGLTPMQAGRTLMKLHAEGLVATDDPLGTANDLAAQFRLASPCERART